MAATDTSSTLKQALQALYHHPEGGIRTQASKWLEEFQQTQEAWQIADQLLHDSSSSYEVLYFCAQTLRTKVQKDYEELPPNAADSLRNSLLALVVRFRQGPALVRTQLCIALAGLAARASSWQWGEGRGVIRWLANELGSQPDAGPGLLELLTVLPQEAESYVRPERRRQFLGELTASVPDVLKLLEAYLAANSSSISHRKQILQALGAWIRYAHGISVSSLATSPLILAALDGLNAPGTFDEAVDAVCELIRFSVAGGPSSLASNIALVQLILSRLMSVKQRFSAALSKNSVINAAPQGGVDLELDENEDTLKGLARVFAEMGEAYVDLIASGSDEALQMVQVIAEVTAHKDYEICSITFNFWHDLSYHLSNSKGDDYGGNNEKAVNLVEKERRLSVFRPVFGLLASLVSFRVQYPPEYESWRKDERADFKQTRYAIADVLLDTAAVYGGEALLQLLAEPLFKEAEAAAAGGTWNVLKAEACLYCIRGIASVIPRSERNVLPKVMELLPKLPPQPLLLYTASLTIAGYADWLEQAASVGTLLPPLLSLLTAALSSSGDAPAAAALAFKHVCDACRNHLVVSIEPLLRVYEQVMAGDGSLRLDPEDELEIVEGLCLVVSALPSEQCPKALQALCLPVVTALEKVVYAAQTDASAVPVLSVYSLHIDRIANIFRYVQQPQLLAAVFQQMWPLLQAVFRQRASDGRIMERLGRACKYSVRSCREHLAPSLGPLLEEVQRLYLEHQQPCCLYVASEVIKVFGRDPSCTAPLAHLINVMFGQTVLLIQTLKDVTERPDIADDCFLLASRCIRYCPDIIVPSPVFSQLLDCALAGILVQHREACKSILNFLKDALDLPLTSAGASFRPIVEAAVMQRGALLTRHLLAALMGGLPESRVDEIVDVFRSLAELSGPPISLWAAAVLQAVPSAAVSDSEKRALLEALGAGGTGRDARRLTAKMEEVSEAARRSTRVMELVHAALQQQPTA